jgi:hypothetical protein
VRTWISVALAVLGALLLPWAAAVLYAREQIVDPDAFADRGVTALDDAAVRRGVQQEIVLGLEDRFGPDRVEAAIEVLEPRIEAVIATEEFRRLFRAAARDTSRRFFFEEQPNATVDLSQAGPLVRAEVRRVSPELARQVPRQLDVELVTLRRDEFDSGDLITADGLRRLGVLLPLLSLAAFAGSIAVAPSRPRGLIVVGMASAVGAMALGVGLWLSREVLVALVEAEGRLTEDELEAAAVALFDTYMNDLYTWAIVLGALAVICVISGAVLLRKQRQT